MSRWVSCWRVRIPARARRLSPRMPPHDSVGHTGDRLGVGRDWSAKLLGAGIGILVATQAVEKDETPTMSASLHWGCGRGGLLGA
jgi:hypothetical protein